MVVPVRLFGERLINAVVKVLVVREDDMTADIVELGYIAEVSKNSRSGY